jgi:hypothetical protein
MHSLAVGFIVNRVSVSVINQHSCASTNRIVDVNEIITPEKNKGKNRDVGEKLTFIVY